MLHRPSSNHIDQEYLSSQLVERIFPGLTEDLLARWRWARTGPAFSAVGRQRLYKIADINSYLEQNRVTMDRAARAGDA